MKMLLLIGAMLGFGIGIGFGLAGEKPLPSALLHACVALYLGAVLMRWWGRKWIQALKDSHEERKRG